MAGAGFGWAGCYLLIARPFRSRAEWWLRAYAEGQNSNPRRPW
jgi:hypothetical protein